MRKDNPVILCVDDDPDVLASLRIVLESDGYVVATARNGKEGLREFGRAKPDLVIMDLMMEDVDSGTRLLKELRALDSGVPIFMLSSTGDYLNNAIDTGEMGLQGVFQKPVDPKILLGLLRAKLGRSPEGGPGKG
ncbi:MAG: response regulator [Deltaproteobacteria bacterium]|nr:response regulator [Deltaproteobacteria bacterium]